jgi:hypothetical protein
MKNNNNFWTNFSLIKNSFLSLKNLNIFNKDKYINYRHAFALPIILNYLDIKIPANAAPFINFTFWFINFTFCIFTLSLICFLSFMNVISYLSAILLLHKFNIVEKYPKLKIVISYYEKSSLIFVIF